jgi:NAD(P)H-dependent FMN reductase
LKYTVISGSHRQNSQSEKVARFISARLKGTHEVFELHLSKNPLPLWDEELSNPNSHWRSSWQPMAAELQSSDALIWVVPEWNGMLPSGVVNLLQLCGHKELGHKPALIISISASANGAYPISQMRMNTTKNNRMVYIPEHMIIRDVENMFNDANKASGDSDTYLRGRLDYCLGILELYAKQLKPIRTADVIDYKSYPNGM